MMQDYTPKPPVYKAAKFDGTMKSIVDFGKDLLGFLGTKPGDPHLYYTGPDRKSYKLNVGNYVILDPSGNLSVMSKYEFLRTYQPVETLEQKSEYDPIEWHPSTPLFNQLLPLVNRLPVEDKAKMHTYLGDMLRTTDVFKPTTDTSSPADTASATDKGQYYE